MSLAAQDRAMASEASAGACWHLKVLPVLLSLLHGPARR